MNVVKNMLLAVTVVSGAAGAMLKTTLAFTMASPLSDITMDIHFEKAVEDADGAYTAINQAFAQYLRDKYPHIRYLDREEDMDIEGLRQAKLSYCPDHLAEKCWARLWEDADED